MSQKERQKELINELATIIYDFLTEHKDELDPIDAIEGATRGLVKFNNDNGIEVG